MTEISAEQVKTYISAGGSKCPFCQSPNLDGWGRVDVDGTIAAQNVSCLDCNRSWTDLYELTTVVGMRDE